MEDLIKRLSETTKSFFHQKNILLDQCSYELMQAGSTRSYIRVTGDSQSYVVQLNQNAKDYERFLKAQELLNRFQVIVPKIYLDDADNMQVIMEDSGPVTLLEEWKGNQSTIIHKYINALGEVLKMQKIPEQEYQRLKDQRYFTREIYLWESNYFLEHILQRFASKECDDGFLKSFEQFSNSLATQCLNHPQALVHRDFQSENLIIKNEGLTVIDFQSIHWGSIYYDLASILWDPYTELSEENRKTLQLRFAEIYPLEFSEKSFLEASLQRVMQACGAYGKLGIQDQKEKYISFIPAGLRQLQRALESYHDCIDSQFYTRLINIINDITENFNSSSN